MTTREKILPSLEPILKAPEHVFIVPEKIVEAARALFDAPMPTWNTQDQLLDTPGQTAQYYFFIDSINFCFWGMKGKTRWEYPIEGDWVGGYYAFSRAVKDAFDHDPRFFDANYLSEITAADFNAIFAAGRNELLQIPERHAIIKENFSILAQRFGGSVLNLLAEANHDADQLVSLLITHFPSFLDAEPFEGMDVFFLKRAQIFPSDLSFSGIDYGIRNLENLTVFADYKLPQLLEHLGVLRYSAKLDTEISEETLIPQGSRKEMELRASSIRAAEDLHAELIRLGKNITVQELDWLLWIKAKETAFTKPHHKTLATFY